MDIKDRQILTKEFNHVSSYPGFTLQSGKNIPYNTEIINP